MARCSYILNDLFVLGVAIISCRCVAWLSINGGFRFTYLHSVIQTKTHAYTHHVFTLMKVCSPVLSLSLFATLLLFLMFQSIDTGYSDDAAEVSL